MISKIRASVRQMLARRLGVPLLHALVGWLGERGFVAYDICGMIRRPLGKAPWQAEMIFVRKDDPLRRDKGYFPGKSWIRS
jgi:hypothetical protein